MRIWILNIGAIVAVGILLVCDCLVTAGAMQELSIQQIIDGVNFSSTAIDSGELRVDFSFSPRPRSKIARENLENRKKRLKREYQNARDPIVKAEAKSILEYYDELSDGPGFPRHYECFMSFKRNRAYDIPDPSSSYSYRISLINRFAEHPDSRLEDRSRLARQLYTVQEIETQIWNLGRDLSFTLNEHLQNTVSKNTLGFQALPYILFSAGYPLLPSRDDQVIGFEAIEEEGVMLYCVEYIPGVPTSEVSNIKQANPVLKIWVDPAKGFSIMRVKKTNDSGELRSTIEYDNFRKFPGEIWYPTSVKITYKEAQDNTVEYLYRIHEAEFNVPIPQNFFEAQEDNFNRLGIETQ